MYIEGLAVVTHAQLSIHKCQGGYAVLPLLLACIDASNLPFGNELNLLHWAAVGISPCVLLLQYLG